MNWNGFFDVSELGDDDLKQLFKESLARSYSSHVDVLKGFRRERHETMTPEQYIEFVLSPTNHNVVIDRGAHSSAQDKVGEVGSRTMRNQDLFLFMYLELDDLYYLVEKFKLKKKLI